MADQHRIIRWEKPMPSGKRGERSTPPWSRYNAIAAELRTRPGEWAVIAEFVGRHTGLATHVRMGSIACFTPAGDFDAVSRQVRRHTTIYARYVGDGAES